jgi:hypothetical protein
MVELGRRVEDRRPETNFRKAGETFEPGITLRARSISARRM